MERRKRRSGLFKWVMIAVIAAGVVVVCRQEYSIYQIKQQQEATRHRIEELQKKQAELQAERKRLDDPRYIEKLAREDYNMVGKNEVPLFIVEEKDEKNTKK